MLCQIAIIIKKEKTTIKVKSADMNKERGKLQQNIYQFLLNKSIFVKKYEKT